MNSRYNLNDISGNENEREDRNALLNLGIEYSWMHYTNPDSEIKFYYGYGPRINAGINRSVQEESDLTWIIHQEIMPGARRREKSNGRVLTYSEYALFSYNAAPGKIS